MKKLPSWEANSHSASQEIPRILWNPNVHYIAHNSLPQDLILSQFNPVHTLSPYFHFNIILSSMPRFPKWCVSFRFHDQNCTHTSHLLHDYYMSSPSYPPWIDTYSQLYLTQLITLKEHSTRFCHSSFSEASHLQVQHFKVATSLTFISLTQSRAITWRVEGEIMS